MLKVVTQTILYETEYRRIRIISSRRDINISSSLNKGNHSVTVVWKAILLSVNFGNVRAVFN